MKIYLLSLLFMIITPWGSSSFSHPGRTDSNGGHYDKSTFLYHCHGSACSKIVVNTEETHLEISRYNRKDWRHWIDEDGDCQNTRAEILISQSDVRVEFATSRKCRVVQGYWIGGLTGIVLSDASDLEIDHVIPLSYAHRHGGFSWTPLKKQRFANDPINLIPTYDLENRKKSDKGPSEYLPSDKTLACAYLGRWQTIATKYGVKIAEKDMAVMRKALTPNSTNLFC